MWCCKFSSGDWIVSSLRNTKKGSIKASTSSIGFNWNVLKGRGIKCKKVIIIEDMT